MRYDVHMSAARKPGLGIPRDSRVAALAARVALASGTRRLSQRAAIEEALTDRVMLLRLGEWLGVRSSRVTLATVLEQFLLMRPETARQFVAEAQQEMETEAP